MPADETGYDRVLAFSLPQRHARGRAVRLGPVLDEILSAHDYPTAIRHLLTEALVLTALIGSLLKDDGGQLTIQAQTQDVGEASESLPIAYAGDVLEIGFNPDFLRDGLESVTEQDVHLKLISPLRPGLITGAGDDFWYLIMPIRLAG